MAAREPDTRPKEAIGQSEVFLTFQERLSRAAKVDRPVLIVGERGTGKELAAVRLHYLSGRWQGPLVTLNCAALASSLLESELFGHEAGAFTGAVRRRQGRFERSHGGTLFLDEIGNTPLEVQEKILRVVEYGRFERVGGSEPVSVDVRIVAATNANLPLLAAEGKFKLDLLDRLSFEVLTLPPLRERTGDISYLANHFAARMAMELGLHEAPTFGEEASLALERHPWPGNIRELKNVVERAIYSASGPEIERIVFDPFGEGPGIPPVPTTTQPPAPEFTGTISLNTPLREQVDALETSLLEEALRQAKYHQRKAARLLGLTYDQFRGLYRRHVARMRS